MSKKKKFLYGLLAFLIIAQFIRIDKTNPTLEPTKDFMSVENPDTKVATLIKSACYDCHSHESSYPWYTNVAPLSWLIKGHIKGGRQQVNFSTWGDNSQEDKQHAMRECIEVLEEKRMPLKSYTWMHAEAKLSDKDRQLLIQYFKGANN